jgi:hypothetical protein
MNLFCSAAEMGAAGNQTTARGLPLFYVATKPCRGSGPYEALCLECLPAIQWRLQLWDAVSSWRQRLHFLFERPSRNRRSTIVITGRTPRKQQGGRPHLPGTQKLARYSEMIAKLIRAGYLQPDQRDDANAITSAIARVKLALRTGNDSERRDPGNGSERRDRK